MRALGEGWTAYDISLIGAVYSLGYTLSSFVTPRFIRRTGHVRVFSAYIALMSISILLQAMSAPGAFAAIPFPPDAPMPEWGVADPRSRTISQGRGARASEPVARAGVGGAFCRFERGYL